VMHRWFVWMALPLLKVFRLWYFCSTQPITTRHFLDVETTQLLETHFESRHR
jgi:hypothetical protein